MSAMTVISTAPMALPDNNTDYVSKLQCITQKLFMPLPRYADGDQGYHSANPFSSVVVVDVGGGSIYAHGAPASTKKQAKQLAAKAMLEQDEIKKLFELVTLAAPHSAAAAIDPISALNEFAQARQLPRPVYTDVRQEGPSHLPHFTVMAVCNAKDGSELACATGDPATTRMQAKRNAAIAILEVLTQPALLRSA